MGTEALDMLDVKKKLKSLREFLPDEPDVIYAFAEALADRLNHHLLPEGMHMVIALLLHDMQRGTDGFTGEVMPPSLTGYPPAVYMALNLAAPQVVKAVCPDDFAARYVAWREAVDKYAATMGS